MIKIQAFAKEYKPGDFPLFSCLFQANQKFDVKYQNKIANRRVETGFEVTDHSYIDPNTISMSGDVSDINRNPNVPLLGLYSLPGLSYFQNKKYIEDLKNNLFRIRDEKMFLVIFNTKDKKYYENYLLTSLTISDSSKTKHGFQYSMELQEVKIGTIGDVATVNNAKAPSKNGNKGQGISSKVGSGSGDGSDSGLKSELYKRGEKITQFFSF